MRIPFRQGIVRYQTDNAVPNPNPTFLQQSNGGSSIDLFVSPDPTILTFAHGEDTNYLFEERLSVPEAWSGPFVAGTDYWIYWDLNVLTGERTFGHTTVEPINSLVLPVTPVNDLHWFDLTTKTLKVFTNGVYVEKVRVFAAKYVSGGVIQAYPLGTQVSLMDTIYAGFLLYDDLGNPVRQVKNKRAGKFITTESNFSSHASNAVALRLEAEVETAVALDNIAAFQCISYKGYNAIGFASNTDLINDIAGIIREDLFIDEVGTFVTSGFVRNPAWNWQENANTPLYCDATGQLTTAIPQTGALQQVGTVVSPTTILVDIKSMIVVEI